MSQFQMIKKIKKTKMLQTKKGKQESGWNERFYLEKIPDYTKAIEPNPCIKQNKNQLNYTKKQMVSNHRGYSIYPYEEEEAYFDLDPEMVELWNILCVTDDYRKKFQQKLKYFKEEVHFLLLDYEKNSLKKVYEYLMIIKSELSLRDKSIELLYQFNEVIKADKTINDDDDSLIKDIKDCLNHINHNTLIIVSATNALRKIYYYDYMKGKFNKAKVTTNELFEPYFLSRLNQKVQFVFDNEPLRSVLQIKGQYYPMIMDLFSNDDNNEEDKKAVLDNLYSVFNEMVYSNYTHHKEKDSADTLQLNQPKRNNKSKSKASMDNPSRGIINTKKYINNPYISHKNNKTKGEEVMIMNSENSKNSSKPHQKNEDKYCIKNEKVVIDCDRKKCKSTSNLGNSGVNDKKIEENESEKAFILPPQVNDDYITNDGDSKTLPKIKRNDSKTISNKKQEEKEDEGILRFEFYTGTLSSLEIDYHQYYSLIPISQKNTFDLCNDINQFTEGINPMLIVGYKKQALSSLCLLSLDPEDHHMVIIKQISTLEINISEIFLKIMVFIQDNIVYKELLINLHFETKGDQYSLNKELIDICKGLSFKWSKLEHLDSGKRIQTMKHKNMNFKDDNDINTPNHLYSFKSGMIAWENKEDNEIQAPEDNNTNTHNNINILNKTVIDHLIKKSSKATEIKNSFSNLIAFEGSKEEIITFCRENDSKEGNLLSLLDSIQSANQLYFTCYALYPMFKTLLTKTINQYIYNRLEIKNEILYEKDTEQTFYMLQQDDYVILLGEMSPGFKSFLDNSKSIYDGFNSLYEKIEVIQKDITHIWVPSFSLKEVSTLCLREENIVLKYYTDVSLNVSTYQGKTFSQEPKSNDRVISNSFFLAIISVSLLNSFNISAIFCDIIDQNKWRSVE